MQSNNKDVVTTITDNSKNSPEDPYDEITTPPVESDLDTITVKLFAIDENGNKVAANEVVEGEEAEYIAVAFDKDGNEVLAGETVEVTFGKDSDDATKDVDYDATKQTVTLGTAFTTSTIDDYLTDDGEVYSVQITDKSLSNAESYETVVINTESVTTTITDQNGTDEIPGKEDTVYIQLSGDASSKEIDGAELTHTLSLVDKDGNEVNLADGEEITVTLSYKDTDTASNADFIDGKVRTVTITGDGSSEYTFSNTIFKDALNDESTEFYDVSIESISSYTEKFENVEIDNANNAGKGTIIDTRPILSQNDVTTLEDNANTQEGTNNLSLKLVRPELSDPSDSSERLGYIQFTFINGSAVSGAKLTDESNTTITTDDQVINFVIVNDDGTLDTSYHYADLDITGENVIALTSEEYEALEIIHAEDNDTDIDINIKVTSYEVDESGKAIDSNDSNPDNTASTDMSVIITAQTDDINLTWDNTDDNVGNRGTFDGDTFTFNDIEENDLSGKVIDLKELLTNTSGTVGDSSADMDGSESRSYTFTGLPEGTIVVYGDQTVQADANGNLTTPISSYNNTNEDVAFTMTFPEYYGSDDTIEGTITLNVFDTDVDTNQSDVTKSKTVDFNINISPVANNITLNFEDASGIEDNKIPLDIYPFSDDDDGSEKFYVTISDIPEGASIYYGGVELSQEGSVTIDNFNSSTSLEILPKENDNSNFDLKVKAYSKDGSAIGDTTDEYTLPVTVKGDADQVINNDLVTSNATDDNNNSNTYTLVATEDSVIDIKDIFNTVDLISSEDTDGSEKLTISIKGLPEGFSIDGAGSPLSFDGIAENRLWNISYDDFKDGNITLIRPENYAGEVELKISFNTQENDGDSLYGDYQDISILIQPEPDAITFTNTATQTSDDTKQVNFDFSFTDTDDQSAGIESLEEFSIDMSSLADGLILKDSNGDILVADENGYANLTITDGVIETITLTSSSNNFDFSYKYTYSDTAIDKDGNTYTKELEGTGTEKYSTNLFYQDIDKDGNPDGGTDGGTPDKNSLIEDTEFTLGDVIFVQINDSTAEDNDFSITIKNLPEGASISGATANEQGEYVISGLADETAVKNALNTIKITPASNENTDANDIANTTLDFDIVLNTYNSSTNNIVDTNTIDFKAPVLPTTDELTLTIDNDEQTDEDIAQEFSITLSNTADGSNTEIIDGKVYIKVTEEYTDIQGTNGTSGTLSYDGNILTLETITGVDEIVDGDYYVVSNVENGDKLDFEFTPASNREGTIKVDTYVNNKESHSWSEHSTEVLNTHESFEFEVTSVEDGIKIETAAIGSNEEDSLIPLSINVISPDSSELPSSMFILNVPDDFIIYYGTNEDGSDKIQASTVGVQGVYSIPLVNGVVPDNIWMKAPENWSGDVSSLGVQVGDESVFIATGEVTPIADGVKVTPNQAFGVVGEDIALNLNASMVDKDGSETLSLTLSGFESDSLTFKEAGTIINSVVYDSTTDTYTIEGIEVDNIGDITFKYDEVFSNNTISFTANTVESDGSTSDSVSGAFALKYSTSSISTHSLAKSISFDNLDDVSSLSSGDNTLDLTLGNNNISLSLNDIIDMTDENNVLEILGDDKDSIDFTDSGWSSQAGSGDDAGFDIYSNNTDGTNNVQVKVEQDIPVI